MEAADLPIAGIACQAELSTSGDISLRCREMSPSVQLVSRPNDEATVLSLAAQIEAARPWVEARPTLAAA